MKTNGIFVFVISHLVPEIFKIFVLCKLGTDDVIRCVNMEVKTSALYGVYTLGFLYQKSHSFASLACSSSDTPQLVCKHRRRALSMKYSIFMSLLVYKPNYI